MAKETTMTFSDTGPAQADIALSAVSGVPLPEALFRPVRYLRPSAALPHLPLLVWLVETLRPRQVLSLGLGDGVAYLAACQAMERLQGGGCTAVLAAGSPIAEDIADHHDRNYRDLSRLIAAPDGASRAGTETHFAAGSVDLVLVPGTGMPDPGPDWQHVLSDHAVILCCGTAAPDMGPDLLPDRPRIRTVHGAEIILTGTDPRSAAPLDALVATQGTSPLYNILHRLGAAQAFESEIAIARAESATARAAHSAAETRAADLAARHDMLTQAYAERSGVLARLQTDLFDLRTMAEERADLQGKLDAAKAEIDARFREIATLTQYLEARAKAHEARIATLTQTLTDSLTRDLTQNLTETLTRTLTTEVTDRVRATEVAPLADRLRAAEAGTAALLNSTSWRITAPFRAVILALRRR
jgi:hypothetical protein